MRWAWDFLRKSSHELFIWHGVVEPNKKQEDDLDAQGKALAQGRGFNSGYHVRFMSC